MTMHVNATKQDQQNNGWVPFQSIRTKQPIHAIFQTAVDYGGPFITNSHGNGEIEISMSLCVCDVKSSASRSCQRT